MALEAGVTYIEDLVATNPVGATDNVDEGDDHIRNIKTAVKGSFPNLGAAAVTGTAAELNYVDVTAAGTAEASKALVLDGSLDVTGINSLTATALSGDLTGDVTGNVTGAATVDVDTLTADTLNGDLELTRNGTGDITVDSTPIYGLVYLNTPVLLATDTSLTATGNTPVDLSAHASITGTAVKVILNVFIELAGGGSGTNSSEVLVGEGGETLTTLVHRAVFLRYVGEDSGDSNQVTVNLASGEIFDYQILQTGTAPNVRTVKIYLAGYYI